MLAPDDRTLLLDALRPPDGARLDLAIGTTYTLDLQALLITPLAFSLFDWAVGDDGAPNVVAILEGLRRYADRTTIFCQAGEIRVPRNYQPAVTFLEDRIVPVTAPDPDHIFHPKAWILRFVDDGGGPVRYRVLCASRNLTFDRSWDTLLALDGTVTDGGAGTDIGLGNFVRLLDQLVPADRDHIRPDLATVVAELPMVAFEVPDGFHDVWFHALAGAGTPMPANPDRTLVVSPFLTAGALDRLRSTALGSDVLISRPEALDRIAIDGWERRYVLSPLVVQPDVVAGDADETATDGPADLQGLHAKLFVFEEGDEVRVFTGSANATDAAFGGNVELLAELVTTRARLGIDRLLAPGEGEPAFRDLLDEHAPVRQPEPVDAEGERLDWVLDIARRRLGGLTYTAHYELDGDDLYLLRLQADGLVDLPPEVSSVRCWRISAGASHAVTVRPAGGFEARFGHVAGAGITAFFAVEVTASVDGREDITTFVVVATVVGAPANRRQRVLTDLLTSRSDVLRYLLFLLADLDGAGMEELAAALAGETGGSELRIDPAGTPLLESLLRALRRDPGRLDHVASLVAELRNTDRAGDLLPERLDEVWEPIWQVRQELSP